MTYDFYGVIFTVNIQLSTGESFTHIDPPPGIILKMVIRNKASLPFCVQSALFAVDLPFHQFISFRNIPKMHVHGNGRQAGILGSEFCVVVKHFDQISSRGGDCDGCDHQCRDEGSRHQNGQ